MKKLASTIVILLIAGFAFAQKIPLKAVIEKIRSGEPVKAEDFGFQSYHVIVKGDTVNFYTYQKGNAALNSIYLDLPGSDAEAIYSYHKDTDGSYWFNSLTSFDFSYLPDNYMLVIAGKPGFGFCGNGNDAHIPQQYWDKTSLQDRVMRAEAALTYVRMHLVKKPERVVVFGYSEGFYVAAKLAALDKHITHLGIGGGGGYCDFYDFVLSNLKEAAEKTQPLDSAINSNKRIIANLAMIMNKPDTIAFEYGYTYKRWSSFSEPAVQNLVKIDIPIYQVHGTADESTPIEDAYIVPMEFARLKKTNLTFKVFPDCDHSLIVHKDGKEINHWDEMMRGFFDWVKYGGSK
jgi:pimeloyl-ACP methyl ester carboxylesterase